MNGSELNKVKRSVIKVLKNGLKNNLFAIVATGSLASGNYKKLWSDVDILIVVEKLDLQTKKEIAQSTKLLEKIHKKHFGINTIIKQEFQNPVLPTISLDGKTLQALLDLTLSPERLIFFKNKQIRKIYLPSKKKEIKGYSISNLFMFLLRNRKTLTSQIAKTPKEYKNMVAKEIRASFIMTKLTIQYFTLHNCSSNKEIVQRAESLFRDFNFRVLKTNIRLIDKWNQINRVHQLDKILKSTDMFIEKFSHYILNNVKNSHRSIRD